MAISKAMDVTTVISIEGNISAGKSTHIKALQSVFSELGRDDVVVLQEPVDEWVDKGFLKTMYENKQDAWLLASFQHMVLMSLAGDLLKALARKPPPKFILTERSPWSNFHIFGKANLEGEPLAMYQHTWQRLIEGLPKMDIKYVYIKTNTDTVMQRMSMRGRQAEACVSREYVSRLAALHDAFLTDAETIDGNQAKEDVWQSLWQKVGVWVGDVDVA